MFDLIRDFRCKSTGNCFNLPIAEAKASPNVSDPFGYASTQTDEEGLLDSADADLPEPAMEDDSLFDPLHQFRTGGEESHRAPAKPKRKFHLHLGRSSGKAPKKREPARLRDVTDIHIENPTFTSDNVIQRNFDAFFESGEPVYSLERRPTPVDLPAPPAGFFGKLRARKTAEHGQQMYGGDGVSTTVGGSQKGDRCASF